MRSRLIKGLIVLVVVLAGAAYLASTLTTPAEAQGKVTWKMASAFGSKLPHLGTSAPRFADNVKVMSGGSLELKFFEPGALVPALECFDAVSKGSVESCWTTPGYHTGKYPALAFFTTVPFGPQIGEFLAWKWFGGGNELRNEIYAKHNLFALDCFAIGPETSGWFRKEVKSVAELKGIKMRFFGLGAQVMQKLGVNTQLMAAADIYPALERGVIDATEFSMPTMDVALGFHQIAKNNYYPGWHQQVSVSELLMNKAEWDKLSEQHKRIIQVALNDAVIHTYVETEAKNPPVMQEMKEKHKVTNRRWSDDDLRAFEKAWLEVLAEESAKDATFKKVADHYLNWRKTYKIWGDAQELKSTYQTATTVAGTPAPSMPSPPSVPAAPAPASAPAPATAAQSTKAVQEALMAKGFNPGPTDGVMGPRTKSAIAGFQKAQGLKESGVLDPDTLAKLGVRQ